MMRVKTPTKHWLQNGDSYWLLITYNKFKEMTKEECAVNKAFLAFVPILLIPKTQDFSEKFSRKQKWDCL